MNVWLTLVVAAVLVAGLSYWMIRRENRGSRTPDSDWGDWPSDHMGL